MYGTGVGTSLMLLAGGAILAFAVDYEVSGIDINAVGLILLVVGLIGLVLSFMVLGDNSFMGRGTRRDVIHDGPPLSDSTVTRRTTSVDPIDGQVDEVTQRETRRG